MSAAPKERRQRKPHRRIEKLRCDECNTPLPRKPYKTVRHEAFDVLYFKCKCGAPNNFDRF